ncbi:EamA family transporter RarD [Caballeronia sp. LZ062]|uniref:EamA family transporter RarD n=1 Tax=unclassified Caballeronia TaxID=2646786 RepID=UPI002861F9DB|nr:MULTISPECIES: EamA family transporter RarD [unclassified Caballeronia]MDR5857158.1 EamA family transporter RarD [Caballeronia sp. LZ050]MDR5869446.1 EamA family transporter RarD [Caballeronia sp. LZ062]
MNQPALGRGIALSVAASALFALLSGYTKWLAPLDGLDIFAWRIVWTLPGALGLVALRRRWPQLCALVAMLAKNVRLLAAFVASAALLGVQLWIFLWAPLHGRALEVSLGYFLLPLAMVLLGRFYYRESLDTLQWAGVAAAAVGVAHEFIATHAFAWPTLVVMLGYPPYFMLRRRLNADPLVAFAIEMMLLAPVALVTLVMRGSFAVVTHSPLLAMLLLPGLGALSTVALASYLRASRYLPLVLFGILGYVEPVLLVGVAVLLLGEPFSANQWGTYAPIWIAVVLTALHSAKLLLRERASETALPVSEHHASVEHEVSAESIKRVD